MSSIKEKNICTHYHKVLLQRSLPKFFQEIQKLQVLYQKNNLKCEQCQYKIDVGNICLRCQAVICDLEKQCLHHHNQQKSDHCIFINLLSTQMTCIICKLEILDFEQYGLTGNEDVFSQWINPQRIRIEYLRYFQKQELSIQRFNSPNVGILNIANFSFMNSILQILLNFPTIQQILSKVHAEMEKGDFNVKSIKKIILRNICCISDALKSKSVKLLNPTELIKSIAQSESKLLGYGQKDAYEAFKYLINFLHEEFRFTNSISYWKNIIPFLNQEAIPHDWLLLSQASKFRDYSFIQNVFSGELQSTLQCLNCNRLTLVNENYSAISLEIPQIHEQNVISKFFNKLTKDRQDAVTLQNCLDLFYEPIQEMNFLCLCGSRNGRRTYKFSKFSNILAIHIQRFKNKHQKDQTYVSFPVEQTNFSNLLNMQGDLNYQLFGLIVHYSNVGGDHFESIVRQPNNTFISIRDDQINPVTLKYVKESEALMLFYQKVDSPTNYKTIHNVLTQYELIQTGEIVLKDDELSFLPNFWFEQFLTLSNPQMIITSHLLCFHNQLKPDYWDFRQSYENVSSQEQMNTSFVCDQSINLQQNNNSSSYFQLQLQSVQLPTAICQFLVEKYGGGPLIQKTIQTCTICIEQAQNMSKRRKLERGLIQKYENCQSDRQFIINLDWIIMWQRYLYNSKSQLQKNFIFGNPPPGEINNLPLLDSNHQLLQDKQVEKDYSLISQQLWTVLVSIYGGGPIIQVSSSSIEQGNSKLKTFDLDPEDNIKVKEIRTILNQCFKMYNICENIDCI
ncbi:unnamed protein product [Paramecium octaurelia]|uniref:ubiquitinyl hydrolase 1 n=1 Tax=Paramecium octaurelia TaxID=43137 RepID=A0A8S1WBC1_PAROT|nr:unnamed protein product [Paramecium octaurelia]